MPNATRLEWIGKYAAILSALVAMGVGIASIPAGRVAEHPGARVATGRYGADDDQRLISPEGWQAMTMLDWEEGRTYGIAPGICVRVFPQDVPVAIEAALRVKAESDGEPAIHHRQI